jgi:glycerol-3-phosphate acyltransferase PlsY
MRPELQYAVSFLFGYLCGSVPFGILLTRLAGGPDLRSVGSGNIGATNVLRTGRKGLAAVTLFGDMLKGTVAVLVTGYFFDQGFALVAAIGAFLGHLFPVWLRFRGGKGVATGLGVMLLICAKAVALAVILWILVVGFWRYASMGSMAAAAAMPIFVYFLYAPPLAPALPVSVGTTVISILVLWMHRPNLQRLIQGTENRLKLPF